MERRTTTARMATSGRRLAANYQGTGGLTKEVQAEAAAWAKVKAGLKKK